ncbi:MAG TPA: hormogonium polysaccharide biosynthesis glycosyltransferase HpsE [Microcoleaceae cyanobacterium]|jgi:glycosyltransferase involved in cell wall biosynthesis
MPIDFTVAIRTYNGATRLPKVLDQLLQQTGTAGITWEVLVVDNNSQDETATVVKHYAQHWRQDSQLKYCFEPRQGSSYARDRAMQEASADLVGFLDDDNIPADNWVAASYHFGQAHPHVGAYGCNIHAQLDGTPPVGFEQINYLLAIEDRGSADFPYQKKNWRLIPSNPGTVIRKQAWQAVVPSRRRLRGRDDSFKLRVSSAEDLEVLYYIHSSPWEIWHNAATKVWHQIPTKRLDQEYFLKLAWNFGLSAHALRIARLRPWLRPFMPLLIPVYVGFSATRLAIFYLKYRGEVTTNLNKACQLRSLQGYLISPFVTPSPTSYQDYPLSQP